MIYRHKRELIEVNVRSEDVVLDVGFHGQGVRQNSELWPHALLKQKAKQVYGLDLELDDLYKGNANYQECSAEQFDFPVKFDLIFAGDLIEHLSNPGLFLDSVRRNLQEGGRLLLTTPNAFNLFSLTEKVTKNEPTVNSDHTLYFNKKVLTRLLEKNNFQVERIDFLYSLGYEHKESLKKKFLNGIYKLLSVFTDKYIETLVIIARPKV